MTEHTHTHTHTQTPLWKDLLLPGAVVLAGACIGLGLYFGGGTTTGGAAAPSPVANPLVALVEATGIDQDEYEACVSSGRTAGLVQADIDNAIATGGRGTPWSIVIGPTGKTYPLNGALPTAAIEQVIELARNEGSPADSQEAENTDLVAPVTDADHIKGNLAAAIKIVEYSDFDCPFCTRFHTSMNQIVSKYDDVAWVYRHFPLEQLHPNARAVAEASECVAELGGSEAFWKFTDGYLR